MNPDFLYFNGINGATGSYWSTSLSPKELADIIRGEKRDPRLLAELKQRWEHDSQAHYAPKESVDPTSLSESGWAAIFAHDGDPAIREALSPLLERRKDQATQNFSRYREYTGVNGYRAGESKQQYLARLPHCVGEGRGVGPGPADPDKVPYYLLIVGDPEVIPFRVQYQLDVQYAVGRIHFEKLDDYARYARAVVEHEKRQDQCRRAIFFGPRNPSDRATGFSADHLVMPLAKLTANHAMNWQVEMVVGEQATKAQLQRLLGGDGMPSVLFTAGHGMAFPNGYGRQFPCQGALLCQDWPGPSEWKAEIPPEFYFAAEDIPNTASLSGLIAFLFACYGGGTPHLDDFAELKSGRPMTIAPRSFLARLPQKLLSCGALAAVAHIDRAWSCSFVWERTGEQLEVFESTLLRLLKGHRLGFAVEYLNQRYAELSSDLSAELEQISFGKLSDNVELSGMWTANNDARNFVVIGDPAVRFNV